MLGGLEGSWMAPEAGGDLLRDGPGVLPTGKDVCQCCCAGGACLLVECWRVCGGGDCHGGCDGGREVAGQRGRGPALMHVGAQSRG